MYNIICSMFLIYIYILFTIYVLVYLYIHITHMLFWGEQTRPHFVHLIGVLPLFIYVCLSLNRIMKSWSQIDFLIHLFFFISLNFSLSLSLGPCFWSRPRSWDCSRALLSHWSQIRIFTFWDSWTTKVSTSVCPSVCLYKCMYTHA